jgi:hypothetical protein
MPIAFSPTASARSGQSPSHGNVSHMVHVLQLLPPASSQCVALATGWRGAISGKGEYALKCGVVCRRAGWEDAKAALDDYLFGIEMDAWSHYYNYQLRAQSDIGRDNRFWRLDVVTSDGRKLKDGYSRTHTYRAPPPFVPKTKCPRSDQ